ncbi:MAG: IS66 family transposase [Polyangiaceae bacterium]
MAEARPDCPGCADLTKKVEALLERVRELEARLKEHSGNSSRPPSSDPPWAPRKAKKPTGNKPGGQPGHEGTSRELVRVPDANVNHVYPTTCRGCGHALSSANAREHSGPLRHQVTELPPLVATVSEHQLHELECPDCGLRTRAPLPVGVPARAFGPRLQAVAAHLVGHHRQSRRLTAEFLTETCGAPISVGAVSALERATSAALEKPYAEAKAALELARSVGADETGTREGRRRAWLWVAVTQLVTVFRVDPRRSRAALLALLGAAFEGIVTSDRYSAYGILPLARRAACWAHLKRDFQKLVDRGGAGAEIGAWGLAEVKRLFELWHLFRAGTIDRASLAQQLAPVKARMGRLLRRGLAADPKTARFCQNLQAIWLALWTFSREDGVEPTNNASERALRPAVIWRGTSFGAHSSAGSRFTERILTVGATLRKHGRNVLAYLEAACRAAIERAPAPALLPAPSG